MGSEDETQTNRRSVRGRGRGRGRPPGRPAKKNAKSPKKSVKTEKAIKKEKDIQINDKDIENSADTRLQKTENHSDLKSPIDFDDSIDSELTSLSFVTPASKALHGNEPLNWKYRVNLIGEKVVNPRIHCCEKCLLPILVYGRMIACKHVFCLNCSQQNDKQCPRCKEKVIRVEKSPLGTVFMCQTESCKRTYLSQRDLQAHIEHRHIRRQISANALNPSNNANINSSISSSKEVTTSHAGVSSRSAPYNSSSFQSPIPVVSSRSNLITVPIQDEVSGALNSGVNSQSSHLVSSPQSVSTYGVPPQSPYNHPNSHMQWPSIPTTTAYGYRPPPSWPPINPYTNPFNRPYGYPQ